jgi:hypothetical protein
VESVLDVTVTANGSGNGGKGKGSGRGRGGKGSGRGRGGKGKGKGKRKKEVEEEMASAPVAPAEFKPAACSFGQERCTRELQASGSQCTYNSCVARSVPAPAASMQTTSKQTASTSPPMDPGTLLSLVFFYGSLLPSPSPPSFRTFLSLMSKHQHVCECHRDCQERCRRRYQKYLRCLPQP